MAEAEKMVRMQCYLTPADLERMRQHYERTGVKMAEQIRRALRQWLKGKK